MPVFEGTIESETRPDESKSLHTLQRNKKSCLNVLETDCQLGDT